jgi:hypothetical protein
LKAEGLNSTKESTTSNGASLQQASCKGQNPTLLAVSTEAGSVSIKTCNTFNDAWLLHARCKRKFPSLLVVLTAAGCLSAKSAPPPMMHETCTQDARASFHHYWPFRQQRGQFPANTATNTTLPGGCMQSVRTRAGQFCAIVRHFDSGGCFFHHNTQQLQRCLLSACIVQGQWCCERWTWKFTFRCHCFFYSNTPKSITAGQAIPIPALGAFRLITELTSRFPPSTSKMSNVVVASQSQKDDPKRRGHNKRGVGTRLPKACFKRSDDRAVSNRI